MRMSVFYVALAMVLVHKVLYKKFIPISQNIIAIQLIKKVISVKIY